MSWSAIYIGTPNKISQKLQEQSASLSGKSKEEFDAALPNLTGLLAQNYNQTAEPIIRMSANGHGHDGYCVCQVSIESLHGVLV